MERTRKIEVADMFFIIGISDGRKDLNFNQMVICSSCGQYGRYTVYMTYTALSLFFIPVFKWNRQYFVQTSCCGKVYRLNPETGRRIAWGEQLEIQPGDLEPLSGGWQSGQYYHRVKRCMSCGFSTDEDYEFCPKCGRRLS
ncbi:MAG: zinc ribbon domain-containing protein [Neglectibacter timonensis]